MSAAQYAHVRAGRALQWCGSAKTCLLLALVIGTAAASAQEPKKDSTEKTWRIASEQQRREIGALIDQLVFAAGEAANTPVYSPGVRDDTEQYRQRFAQCQDAFKQLAALKDLAFPQLVEHLSDKRQSINFRNHHINNSVGDACYWVIHTQLQDKPDGYSSYGLQRKGRDGKNHVKPYWEGTPFERAGGLEKWLEVNKGLSYPKMQIKCLEWLLEKEKAIGASNAESYFVNILPLEIRILERRFETGEDTAAELRTKQKMLKEKDVKGIPRGTLPDD